MENSLTQTSADPEKTPSRYFVWFAEEWLSSVIFCVLQRPLLLSFKLSLSPSSVFVKQDAATSFTVPAAEVCFLSSRPT